MGDENAVRDNDFNAEANNADAPFGPPIETMGASYGIKAFSAIGAQRGAPSPPVSVLMPNVNMRNGGTERVADSIGRTPLGGLMPGPNAIAPAIPAGEVGRTFDPGDAVEGTEFGMGIADAYPEGCPVPTR